MFDFSLTQDCHDLKFHTHSELHCGWFLILRLRNCCVSWARFEPPSQLSYLPLSSCHPAPLSWAARLLHIWYKHMGSCTGPQTARFQEVTCALYNDMWKLSPWRKQHITQKCLKTLHITRFPLPSNESCYFSPMCPIDVNKYSFLQNSVHLDEIYCRNLSLLQGFWALYVSLASIHSTNLPKFSISCHLRSLSCYTRPPLLLFPSDSPPRKFLLVLPMC